MTRDQGRGGDDWIGRLARCGGGGLIAGVLLAAAGPAMAFQSRTTGPTVTPSPVASGPKTYADCLHDYAYRRDVAMTCARLFPAAAAPAATAPATTAPATTTTTPNATPPPAASTPAATPTRQPVDITPQVTKLIEAWKNRPKSTPKPPADPLAVIPGIQAACADYVGVPERWRRCTLDAWRTAGFSGQPPLVLQNPPVVAPPPVAPPPVQPPVAYPPVAPPPVVQSKPPVQTPPPLTPETVQPEPVVPTTVAVPEPPPAAVVPSTPAPPPAVVPPPPSKPPATPIWFWLLALAAAAGTGFGLAKLLSRPRPPRPDKVSPALCPEVALVADPGVVVLTPDGAPRAGMAVSLHFERAGGEDAVSLDYPTLETTP